MTEATPDPTLATLIPEPSRRRTVALAALGVALLAAAWFLVPLLRPTLTQDAVSHRSSSKDVPVSVYEVTTAESLTIERVTGNPAAEVVGAWIVPGADGWADLTDTPPGRDTGGPPPRLGDRP